MQIHAHTCIREIKPLSYLSELHLGRAVGKKSGYGEKARPMLIKKPRAGGKPAPVSPAPLCVVVM